MWYAAEVLLDELPARWHVVALFRSPQAAAEYAGFRRRDGDEREYRTRLFVGSVSEPADSADLTPPA